MSKILKILKILDKYSSNEQTYCGSRNTCQNLVTICGKFVLENFDIWCEFNLILILLYFFFLFETNIRCDVLNKYIIINRKHEKIMSFHGILYFFFQLVKILCVYKQTIKRDIVDMPKKKKIMCFVLT